MKKILLLFALSTAAAGAFAQPYDSVSITLCKQFWKTGEPINGSGFSLVDYLPGLPVVGEVFFSVDPDESCLTNVVVSADSFQSGYQKCYNAYKTDDYANGISILDVIAARKYVLGIEPLESPYGLLAGDLNLSGGISTFDLVLMVRAMLGFDPPSGPAWRFYAETCDFPNPANPFSGGGCPCILPQGIPSWHGDTLEFIGVKVGDVDGDANPNGLYAGPPTFDSVALVLPVGILQPGVLTAVPVHFESAYPLSGLQIELLLDTATVQLDSISSAGLSIGYVYNNFALFPDGRVRLVATSQSPLPSGSHLFTLHLIADEPVALSDAVHIGNGLAPAVATPGEKEALKLGDKFSGSLVAVQELSVGDAVFPAAPNPFRDNCFVPVRLTEAGAVSLTVTDVAGRETYRYAAVLGAGEHRLEIPASAVAPGAMALYSVQAGRRSAAGKVVRQ